MAARALVISARGVKIPAYHCKQVSIRPHDYKTEHNCGNANKGQSICAGFALLTKSLTFGSLEDWY